MMDDLARAIRQLDDPEVNALLGEAVERRDAFAETRPRVAEVFSALAAVLDEVRQGERAALFEQEDPDREEGDAEWTTPEDLEDDGGTA